MWTSINQYLIATHHKTTNCYCTNHSHILYYTVLYIASMLSYGCFHTNNQFLRRVIYVPNPCCLISDKIGFFQYWSWLGSTPNQKYCIHHIIWGNNSMYKLIIYFVDNVNKKRASKSTAVYMRGQTHRVRWNPISLHFTGFKFPNQNQYIEKTSKVLMWCGAKLGLLCHQGNRCFLATTGGVYVHWTAGGSQRYQWQTDPAKGCLLFQAPYLSLTQGSVYRPNSSITIRPHTGSESAFTFSKEAEAKSSSTWKEVQVLNFRKRRKKSFSSMKCIYRQNYCVHNQLLLNSNIWPHYLKQPWEFVLPVENITYNQNEALTVTGWINLPDFGGPSSVHQKSELVKYLNSNLMDYHKICFAHSSWPGDHCCESGTSHYLLFAKDRRWAWT